MANEMGKTLDDVKAAVQSGKLSKSAEANLQTWLTQPQYEQYQSRLKHLIDEGQWSTLQDSFWERIPFGTAGRRGPMSELGTATMNERTIAESAHGVAVHVNNYFDFFQAGLDHDQTTCGQIQRRDNGSSNGSSNGSNNGNNRFRCRGRHSLNLDWLRWRHGYYGCFRV